MSSVQAAGQTIVNFLTLDLNDTSATEQRVFDMLISREAQQYYTSQMAALQHLLLEGKKYNTNTSQYESDPNAIADILTILTDLNNWSRYKYVTSGGAQTENILNCPLSTPSTMSRYMAEALDTLNRTLAAAGLTPKVLNAGGTAANTALAAIQSDDISTSPMYNIRSILAQGLAASAGAAIIGDTTTQSNSIQQLLMVDYVINGNNLLFQNMNDLQNAINTNQQILSYLNSLQDLMNQKSPDKFLMQLSNLSKSTPDYSAFEKATFGEQPIGTTAKFTDADIQRYLALLQIQNSGGDVNDIVTLAQNGLISTSAEMQALFTALTTPDSAGNTILPTSLSNFISIPSDITEGADQDLYRRVAVANIAGVCLEKPADLTPAQNLNSSTAYSIWARDMFNYGISSTYVGLSNIFQSFGYTQFNNVSGVVTALNALKATGKYTLPTSSEGINKLAYYFFSGFGYAPGSSGSQEDAVAENARVRAIQSEMIADPSADWASLAVQDRHGFSGIGDQALIEKILSIIHNNNWQIDNWPADPPPDQPWNPPGWQTIFVDAGVWSTDTKNNNANSPTFASMFSSRTLPSCTDLAPPSVWAQYHLDSLTASQIAPFYRSILLKDFYGSTWTNIALKNLAAPTLPSAQTPSPLLGTDSVTVLLNLQGANLLDDIYSSQTTVVDNNGVVDQTSLSELDKGTILKYKLTQTDVDDYYKICHIKADGKDPTDASIQTSYGLTVRNTNLAANEIAGTSPQAFIDVISGQYNGAGGIQQIRDNLTALINLVKKQVDPSSGSSLISELSQVLTDFNSITSIATWVANFKDNAEGTYQSNLNNAVVASQSLNDTQREKLQMVMFVYQQFYQSASSMLSSITTLLQTIASNISR